MSSSLRILAVWCSSCLACAAPGGDDTETSQGSTAGSSSGESTATSSAATSMGDAGSSSIGSDATTSGTTATDADTSTGAPLPEAIRVLFVGNSYTFVNDLPTMVATLADSVDRPLDVDMIAVGGATLADHVANPQVTTTLAEGWDVVVIQGQSVEPIVQLEVFVQGAVDLAAMVDAGTPGATLLLYETWARREGDPLLADLGMTAPQMQQALTDGYAAAAMASGGRVVPAGQTWALALAQAPAIDLFAADGSHPSVAGTYVAGCVFFRALTEIPAVEIDVAIAGVDAADADTLESIADMLAP